MSQQFRACSSFAVLLLLGLAGPAMAETTALVPRHTMVPVILTKEIRVGGMGDAQQKKVEFEASTNVI